MLEEFDFDFSSPGATAFSVFLIIVTIMVIIAEWRILTKAGEKGWKSLIPFYNIYISHHIVGMKHFWFVLEVIVWSIEFVLAILEPVPDWAELAFGIPTALITLISALIHINLLCNCFGKGSWYKICMIFVPEVIMMIIAFGKAEYTKPAAH